MSPDLDDCAGILEDALCAKDMDRFSATLVVLAGRIGERQTEELARLVLGRMPHDVQMYWNGECNCDGHMN